MTETAPASRKSCLRRGCFGCLVVFGGIVGLVMLMAVITLVRGVPEVVREDTRVTHTVPAGTPLQVGKGQIGRVVLDVTLGSFVIVPAPAGSELKLDARYNSGAFKLEESMSSNGELGWTYRLSFGRRSFFDFITVEAEDNRLVLHLPAGTPLVIEGDLGLGETDLQLGGLWVERVDLDAGIGEHRIGFDEPLSVPMTSFRLDGSIGETKIYNLGNASPAEVQVAHRIGEVFVDLDGAWRNDATVSVRGSIGAYQVGLPDDGIGFELLRASIGLGEATTQRAFDRPEAPPGAPVVRLEASNSLGELHLSR